MLSMTSLRLLVGLLSVLQHVQLADFIEDYEDFTSTAVNLFNNQVHARSTCADRDEIARWINEQVMRNAKLTRFNQRMGQLLDSLNTNMSAQAQEEHCCFYEKNTMDRIFLDIQSLSGKNDIVGEVLKSSGDIGKDLDSILTRMKLISDRDLKTCCNQLTNELKELEKNLTMELENLNQKLNGLKDNELAEKEQLQRKQAELENLQKELTKQIDLLENREKENLAKANDETCCDKLNEKLNELAIKMDAAKTETDKRAEKLENELREMKTKQEEQGDKLKVFKEELQRNSRNLAVIGQNCEKKCKKRNQKDKNNENLQEQEQEQNLNDDSIINQLEVLESSIKELNKTSANINNFNSSLTECDEISERLKIADKTLHNLTDVYNEIRFFNMNIDKNNDNNCCLCQDTSEVNHEDNNENKINITNENKDKDTNNNNNNKNKKDDINNNKQLTETMTIARNCCKNIDSLEESNKQLRKHIESSDKEGNTKINELNEDIKKLQNRIDKISENAKNPNLQNNQAESDISERIKQLQEELTKVKSTLPINEKKLDDNNEKLKEIEENANQKFKELADQLEKQEKENKILKLDAENNKGKETIPTNNNLNEQLVGILESLGFLKGRYKELNDDVNKVKQLEERIDDLDKKVDNALAKLAENEAEMSKCLSKCKKLDHIDDLIDRIEDVEESVANGTNKKKKKATAEEREIEVDLNSKERKLNTSLIGSTDSYTVHQG